MSPHDPQDPYRPQPAPGQDQPQHPAPPPSWGPPPAGPPASGRPPADQPTADQPQAGQPQTGQPFGGYTQPLFAEPPGAAATGQQPRTSRRRPGVVVTAALLAGLLGGIGGGAAWSAIDDDPAAVTTQQTLADDGGPAPTADRGGVEKVAAAVLPAVVKISERTAQGGGSGSGVVLSSDGQILTNNHVVADAVGDLVVSFNDGTTAPATVVGTDPLTDLAVIQAKGVSGLTTASLGSSGDLAVGEQVVAVGSPFGLESTVTSGIVSALDRPVDTGASTGQGSVFPAIQTDAAINPGNSGGALVDMSGDVVGINSAIRTSGTTVGTEGGSIGLGFAIPIDEARPIVAELSEGDAATHARIGIGVNDAVGAGGVTTTGALVEDVTAGSAGDEAGLQRGDVVTAVDGELVTGADDLVATVRKYRPGDEVTLTYRRGDESEQTTITLDSDEGSPTT